MTDTATTAARGYGRGPENAAIVVAGLWHLTNDLYGLALAWSGVARPGVVTVSWLVFAAVGTAAAIRLVRRRDEGWAFPVAATVVLLMAVVANAVVVPPAENFGFAHWAWASFGWFAMLLWWRRPIGWTIGALALNGVVVMVSLAATRHLSSTDVARVAMVLYGASAIQLGVVWGGKFLEATARRAAHATAERDRIVTERLAAVQVHLDRRRRYAEIGADVRQTLAGLADGTRDPSYQDDRRTCAVQASRLRRLIAEYDDQPVPLLHELGACATVAEKRGVMVTLDAVGLLVPVPVAARRALCDVSIHVLEAAGREARITVLTADVPVQVEVSVVVDAVDNLPTIPPHSAVDVSVSREGELWWVRARWLATP